MKYKRPKSRKAWSINANCKKERLRIERGKAAEQDLKKLVGGNVINYDH